MQNPTFIDFQEHKRHRGDGQRARRLVRQVRPHPLHAVARRGRGEVGLRRLPHPRIDLRRGGRFLFGVGALAQPAALPRPRC